jgi:hypothetical protein
MQRTRRLDAALRSARGRSPLLITRLGRIVP